MKLPSPKAIVFNAAALLIVFASVGAVIRSMLFHDDAPPCADRYQHGSQLVLDRGGEPLAAAELQARLSGTDWGLIESTRIVKLKSGPAPFALEHALARANDKQAGVGFTWVPYGFEPVEAACLVYSVFLDEDFDFASGGRLPGLFGARVDAVETAAPDFSTRYAWREDGSGDIFTHLPGWTTGRSLGNDRYGFTFPKGRWVALEQEVVLNTPGEKNGLLRIWVDGRLRFEKSDVVFREAAGPTANARIAGVLAETALLADRATEKHLLWISPFELRWR